MNRALLNLVRERALFCCEYCLLPDTVLTHIFQIDHILAEKHGGETVESNLAFCCPYCNRHKGPNIAGLDPDRVGLDPVRLYHPRQDEWTEHFFIQDSLIVGKTAIGRATVNVLRMNKEAYRAVRESLLMAGLYPPLHYQP